MKRGWLITLLIAFSLGIKAQQRVGLEVRGSVGMYTTEDSKKSVFYQYSGAFAHIGALANVRLYRGLGIETGLLYTGKWGHNYPGRYLEEKDAFLRSSDLSLRYIEMPILVYFKVKQRRLRMIPRLGLYMGIPLSGESEHNYETDFYDKQYHHFYSEKKTLQIGNSATDNITPFDIGVSTGIGWEWGRATWGAMINVGCQDVFPNLNGRTVRGITFGFYAGFKLIKEYSPKQLIEEVERKEQLLETTEITPNP
jgi:hypothetical protein